MTNLTRMRVAIYILFLKLPCLYQYIHVYNFFISYIDMNKYIYIFFNWLGQLQFKGTNYIESHLGVRQFFTRSRARANWRANRRANRNSRVQYYMAVASNYFLWGHMRSIIFLRKSPANEMTSVRHNNNNSCALCT